MSVIKSLARDWLPPAILRAIQHRRGSGIRFEGDYSTWEEAAAQCTGYDAAPILVKVLEATLKVKRGEAAYERDSVLFDEIQYAWPVTAGLMWVAAQSGGRLDVLDFGGALGSSYFQNWKFLRTLREVRWNIVEQSHYVDVGRANIQNDQLRFYNTIDECLDENMPTVVLMASVLQYLEFPFDIIRRLPGDHFRFLIIDRTPFSAHDKDVLMTQRVPSSIYAASYPVWIFSYLKFLRELDRNWHLIASYTCPEELVHSANGFKLLFQGMLLETHR